MTKIVDIEKSVHAANGNAKLAKDLFRMLIKDLDSRLEQINSSFANNDMENLAEHVHKLYGATAYCIVPNLRHVAENLENSLKDKRYSELPVLIELIVKEMNQLIKEGPQFIEQEWQTVMS